MGRKILIGISVIVIGLMFVAMNKGLSYYDPPSKIKWVKYRVPENQYLSNIAAKLSNSLDKHIQTLVAIIKKKNRIRDNYLREGEIILIPAKKMVNGNSFLACLRKFLKWK